MRFSKTQLIFQGEHHSTTFVQFDEPRPVLIINSESVKPFVYAF